MTGNNNQFDENLKRLLQSALDQPRPAFQKRLVRDVLAAVVRQRQLESPTSEREGERVYQPKSSWEAIRSRLELPGVSLGKAFALAGAGAAVVLAVAGVWLATSSAGRTVGQVRCLYGVVAVRENGSAETVAAAADLKSGQRIQTRVGSRAEIILPDNSRLLPDPRTVLQIARSRQGPRILLERGSMQLDAAIQPAGKAICIEASGAHITVLGTRLEVRLVERPSGTRQTRVRVLSGQVEMESGGQTVLLFRGTEGVAEAHQPPTRSSAVFEVNQLVAMLNESGALAGQSSRRCGLPAIIDLTTETLWSLVPVQRLQATGLDQLGLKLRYPAFRAAAFTLDGAQIPTAGSGQILRLDLSAMPNARLGRYVILKVPGVGGLVRETEDGLLECSLAGTESNLPALLQVHLPESARLEQMVPGARGVRQERNRLIVTLTASAALPQVCE